MNAAHCRWWLGGVTLPRYLKTADRPDAIVSLSPTATEMLYALGAGHEVKAVDSDSDYPAGAPVTKLSAYQPNAEAIAIGMTVPVQASAFGHPA